jgi:hypothetical protein
MLLLQPLQQRVNCLTTGRKDPATSELNVRLHQPFPLPSSKLPMAGETVNVGVHFASFTKLGPSRKDGPTQQLVNFSCKALETISLVTRGSFDNVQK